MQSFSVTAYPLYPDQAESPLITAFVPQQISYQCAIVILPGGSYYFRAEHEGSGYATFLAEHGIPSFVVNYRCNTHKFPIPLLDAQRGIRFARNMADKIGFNPEKIAIMGSSAGGHLAALTAVYRGEIPTLHTPDAIDLLSPIPNAQILCYPVISLVDDTITHKNSVYNLLGTDDPKPRLALSPDHIAPSDTPPAFIWHTAEDAEVNVLNSLYYARRLREMSISTELHIFPEGVHGMGLCKGSDTISCYNAKWSELLLSWLSFIGFKKEEHS